MKPWKEGDGAVEKFILIKITEQDAGSGFPVLTCAASPCDSELWDRILGYWCYHKPNPPPVAWSLRVRG